jgi:hypothetical protein
LKEEDIVECGRQMGSFKALLPYSTTFTLDSIDQTAASFSSVNHSRSEKQYGIYSAETVGLDTFPL